MIYPGVLDFKREIAGPSYPTDGLAFRWTMDGSLTSEAGAGWTPKTFSLMTGTMDYSTGIVNQSVKGSLIS